jgi:pimeloyl-ACP methyl ester carboxylesterase
LSVPLDHAGLRAGPQDPGRLALRVAIGDNVDAPRGVLIRVVGGPGAPGLPLAADITSHEIDPPVQHDYRMVFIDQRGTGAGALQCPQLQRTMGNSSLTVPPPLEVQACAKAIGEARRFFTTADTVADLESLRQALRVDKLSLDGASYGAFVAERYAIAHPDRVSRLVLDSVVPHDGLDPLFVADFARTAEVLGIVCREIGCGTDPAHDLSQVVNVRRNGAQMLNVILGMTAGKPRLNDLPPLLHEAADGEYERLDALVATEENNAAIAPEKYSQGLHTSTACEDLIRPWGDAASPVADRASATEKAVAALSDSAVFPYDRDAAGRNGTVVICQQWPATPVVPFRTGRSLPPVPTLLLAGDHDLVTPLAWTQQEAARAPRGELIVIPGSGHITQDAANGPAGREAVARFLTTG